MRGGARGPPLDNVCEHMIVQACKPRLARAQHSTAQHANTNATHYRYTRHPLPLTCANDVGYGWVAPQPFYAN